MNKMLIFIVVIFLNSTISAQLVRGYGIKLGTTISNQEWDYNNSLGVSFDPDNRTGLNIGVFAEFLNIPVVSIIGEINYIQKGMTKEIDITTMESPEGVGKAKWDTRLDYLSFAALGKLRLNYGLITPYLLIGPKIDIEINKDLSEINASIVEDKFNKNRFGIKFGIGSEINILPVTLLAEILYDADFNALYENNNLKITSDSFDIRIGVMF